MAIMALLRNCTPYLQSLYASLLADPAISGLTIGALWAKLQPSAGTSASSFDWSDLDDAFDAATAAHKPVQLIITPGADMPTWLVNQIPPCDPLFTTGTEPANCGTVTFVGYPEVQRAVQTVFPLPWNTVYQAAWDAFLMQLNARYGSNPLFVAIAISGPVGASDEMIFPTSVNTTVAQPSGLAADATWAALIQHSFPSNSAYQNTDQVFIDAWKQAIDAYESIFSGVTLFIGADSGNDFPNFSQTVTRHADNTLFAVDCSNSPKTEIMSCEAKTEILSYFVTVTGLNGKGTQVGGMTASSAATIGNIGVQGVKVLTGLTPAPSPPFIWRGGIRFSSFRVIPPGRRLSRSQRQLPGPIGCGGRLQCDDRLFHRYSGCGVLWWCGRDRAHSVSRSFLPGSSICAIECVSCYTEPHARLYVAPGSVRPRKPRHFRYGEPDNGATRVNLLEVRAGADNHPCRQRGRRDPKHRPKHVGRDQGIESRGARRFTHLAGLGLCRQFHCRPSWTTLAPR
jgi:hypothetical protein